MRSLFVKIFLTFLLITIVASVTTVLIAFNTPIGPHAQFRSILISHQKQALEQSLRLAARAVAEFRNNNADVAPAGLISDLEKNTENRFFLLDQHNTSLSAQPPPPEALELANAARSTGTSQHHSDHQNILVALPLPGLDSNGLIILGQSLVVKPRLPFQALAAKQPRSPLPLPELNPNRTGFWLPITVLLLVASAVCLVLARSLTAPIRRLRTTTQRLAQGDLSARVGHNPAGKGDEVADLSRDFDIMADRLQALLTSQRRLLRDISHELRSPLARHNVALELARHSATPECEPYLQRMEQESQRLNELIDHLLTFTRLEADGRAEKREAIDLSKLVNKIGQDADFEARSQQRRVEVIVENEATMNGSPEMMRRGLENIVRNGVHYTEVGTMVTLHLSTMADQAVIAVRDFGPGVPEAGLEHIFTPFYRVASSRNRRSGGTGIGLAIARQAAELHGGQIKAYNKNDGGLVVEITIPLA